MTSPLWQGEPANNLSVGKELAFGMGAIEVVLMLVAIVVAVVVLSRGDRGEPAAPDRRGPRGDGPEGA
jgi:hypothetical protein